MIVVCPLCQTRYLVPASLFAHGTRQVRCARCSHSWTAELPPAVEVVMPPLASDEWVPVAPRPLPPGSNLPALRGINWPIWAQSAAAVLAALMLALLLWVVFDREDIARGWPVMTALYDTIGLHIYYAGEGLSFAEVHSELAYDSGIMKLAVTGKIKNKTGKVLTIPGIMAIALGPDGDVMQSWQIDAPAATLAPAAAVPFRSAINAPKGAVTNVNLNFIEPVNDAEH